MIRYEEPDECDNCGDAERAAAEERARIVAGLRARARSVHRVSVAKATALRLAARDIEQDREEWER